MRTEWCAMLLIVTTLSFAQGKKYDGYWWNGIGAEGTDPQMNKIVADYMQTGYVAGVVDQAKEDEIRCTLFYGRDTSYQVSFWFKNLENVFDHYSGVTFGQFVQGVSEFYKDYRNLQINVTSAMYVVSMEVKGEPREEIDSVLADLRSVGSFDGQIYKKVALEELEMAKRFERELAGFNNVEVWRNSWPAEMSAGETAARQRFYESRRTSPMRKKDNKK